MRKNAVIAAPAGLLEDVLEVPEAEAEESAVDSEQRDDPAGTMLLTTCENGQLKATPPKDYGVAISDFEVKMRRTRKRSSRPMNHPASAMAPPTKTIPTVSSEPTPGFRRG